VNWQHFRAFLWLRWRLRVNQLKRGGIANAIFLAILAVGAGIAAFSLFVVFLLVGLFALSKEAPLVVLFVWDGLVVTLLFFWAVGLLAELQRAEVLSLDKFLHLPVSLWGAFLLNYLSSLLSLNLIVFLPAMIGFSLGLVFARGPVMLVCVPLLAAFVLMVTALTYQFQGWLAALMVNKRRRRTILVVVTVAFVLVFQLPQLLNFLNVFQPSNKPYFEKGIELDRRFANEQAKLKESLASGDITPDQYQQRQDEMDRKHKGQTEELYRDTIEVAERIGRLVNLVLPPGWLPLGAMAAVEGDMVPGILGTVGLTLIGTASLWRSYRTTVRLYTGHFTSGKSRKVAAPHPLPLSPTGRGVGGEGPALKPEMQSAGLLEKDIPWLSEQASAIALAGFRSLTRAPEAKMMLLTPVILVLVFGSMALTRSLDLPRSLRPLMAFGGMATVLLGMVQLVGNQFGFDRGGFRVLVLCAAPRRDILLGKNLSFAPLGVGLALVMVVVVQIIYPMRFDHFLAALPQAISMYLTVCVMGNWLSMLAPMPIASGSLKPSNPKLIPVLLQVVFVFLLPMTLSPTLLPLGIELLVENLGGVEGIPICLILSLVECLAVVCVYRLFLTWQGSFLQAREQRILEIVTTKAE